MADTTSAIPSASRLAGRPVQHAAVALSWTPKTTTGDAGAMQADFHQWIAEEFTRGPFTALILVLDIEELTAEPVASTYLHVIGDEVHWADMRKLLGGAPHKWNAAAFFPSREKGGPVPDRLAKVRLLDLEERVGANRLELNNGAFFDKKGRRMQIEEAKP